MSMVESILLLTVKVECLKIFENSVKSIIISESVYKMQWTQASQEPSLNTSRKVVKSNQLFTYNIIQLYRCDYILTFAHLKLRTTVQLSIRTCHAPIKIRKPLLILLCNIDKKNFKNIFKQSVFNNNIKCEYYCVV